MNHFYDLGKAHLSYAGMDDAGEMSSWYVFNAMGFYPFSPADPKYMISVPLFDKIQIQLDNGRTYTVVKRNSGKKITNLSYGGKKITDYVIQDKELKEGKQLEITTK
jgi:putative alpha-1,2-mannosidase